MSAHIESQVRLKLQQIQPVTLQKLAEDLASIKFPDRFGRRVLLRLGRNDEDQTTKGWPDAYVSTGPNEVDGVEATRQEQTWKSHLKADLAHASDPKYRNLSGYVFVGGYPSAAPTSAEIDNLVDGFVAAGVDRARVTILVGSDLVAELCKPEYAFVRQVHLGLASESSYFRQLGASPVDDVRLGPFQPTQEDYDAGRVSAPAVMEAVVGDILESQCALVWGYGAAGKTTLAELIARADRISPNAVWYLDLAQASEAGVGAALLNEMTGLSARGTLFVIDNVHIDAPRAIRILDHWNRHLLPLGTRLLLLGRRTSWSTSRIRSAIPSHDLRAGVQEMLAVANRLARRQGRNLPAVPREAADEWARTFGGSDRPEQMAVDLIAFTAAVDRRLDQIVAGDFRLSAADAVDAVRTRYLQPLQANGELPNILRLAALAEFEIPLLDEQMPAPVAGLSDATNKLGLVVQDYIGLEARRNYRLVHAGVAPLLVSAAAGGSFRVEDERLTAVSQTPGLGLRICAALKRSQPGSGALRAFDDAVLRALRTTDWPRLTHSLYELGLLASWAVRNGGADPTAIDDVIIASDAIPRLLGRARAIPSLLHVLGYAERLRLPRTSEAIGAAISKRPLLDALSNSRSNEVVSLIRAAPNGKEILQSIDAADWGNGQSRCPSERVGDTVAACRFLEMSSRPDLARAPALNQVQRADVRLWDDLNISHISHLLRIAKPDHAATEALLGALTTAGWLETAIVQARNGPLCGTLFSLAVYLPVDLRRYVLIPQLERRVVQELTAPRSGENQKWSQRVCLFGGFYALGGVCQTVPSVDWSADSSAEEALREVAHQDDTGELGTYELQLWLGLKALHRLGQGPAAVPALRGESLRNRLSGRDSPTPEGADLHKGLVEWLEELRAAGWRCGKPPAQ